MNDKTLIAAALIVGGAIVAASFQTRARFALSAATDRVAWRMDTWSGQVDICAARYTPQGPLVRCGAFVVVPADPNQTKGETSPSGSDPLTLPLPPTSESGRL
jgi:hypothetical protein